MAESARMGAQQMFALFTEMQENFSVKNKKRVCQLKTVRSFDDGS